MNFYLHGIFSLSGDFLTTSLLPSNHNQDLDNSNHPLHPNNGTHANQSNQHGQHGQHQHGQHGGQLAPFSDGSLLHHAFNPSRSTHRPGHRAPYGTQGSCSDEMANRAGVVVGDDLSQSDMHGVWLFLNEYLDKHNVGICGFSFTKDVEGIFFF